ncbi:MAG TPA: S9 family peptidase [Gemmatimonadaceae bacterium]|nr:S9 family peptidase [Gemmatimonadaceae bacterium]
MLARLTVATVTLIAATVVVPARAAHAQHVVGAPSFKDVLSLRSVGDVAISPDGSAVAYTVSGADWAENKYHTEIWLAHRGAKPFQLTRNGKASSSNPAWSPDGTWIAFLSSRDDHSQIWAIRTDGGEARPLTDVSSGVDGFAWSPDGKSIALTMPDSESTALQHRDKEWGTWRVESENAPRSHLWVLDVAGALATANGAKLPGDSAAAPAALRRLTRGDDYTVGSFHWSPDGSAIAFDHQPNKRVPMFTHADISVVDVATDAIRPLVTWPGADHDPIWSPDGKWIAFSTQDKDSAYYQTDEIAKVPATGGEPVLLTGAYDYNADAVAWLTSGLVFQGWHDGQRMLYRMDPDSRQITVIAAGPEQIGPMDYTRDGRFAAFAAATPTQLGEVYLTSAEPWHPERLTDMTAQVAGWPIGAERWVHWKSKDGTAVSGVLITPAHYDSTRRHPLIVEIHGGPTGIDVPTLPEQFETYVYPLSQWLAKGAVIFRPNYRGSMGYGQAFEKLNVDNLGVGDAWDVMSGVQALIDRGIAAPDSMAAMGWSEGGYISAFLTTTTTKFKAISVGAGISDWMTYYVNTDVHPFTLSYLGGTPWDQPKLYAKTSPITYIKQAKTPTLIQHDTRDPRVPPPDAFELYQGLQDQGVPTKLILYDASTHGIPTPKQRLAAMWHNWTWMAKYVWGETVQPPFPEHP